MGAENAREAISIAKQVIQEAGYVNFQVKKTEFDEDEEIWYVYAQSGDTGIEIEIDAESGEVMKFDTD